MLVWSITGVELMLDRNSITNVNSLTATGQLIPLIIGVATVVKLMFNATSEDYVPPLLIWGFFVSGNTITMNLRKSKADEGSSMRSRRCLLSLRARV